MKIGHNIQRRLIGSILFGLVVFIALAIFGDVRAVGASLREFNWWWMPVILALALGNYALRIVRWVYYLKYIGVDLPLKDSVTVFMSGLALSITPGKLGELVKSYFLRRMCNTPVPRSVAVIFAERYTDLVAVVALAAIGVFQLEHGRIVFWLGATATAAMFVIIMNRRLAVPAIQMVGRVPRLHKASDKLLEIYEQAYELLKPTPLLLATGLALVSWFLECVGLYLTLDALGHPIPLSTATFIYAFSTLFGAVTMLPGGLITTEGSMTGLTMLQGVPKDAASASTIVIRVATLWFAVLLGLLWLAPNRNTLIPDEDALREGETRS